LEKIARDLVERVGKGNGALLQRKLNEIAAQIAMVHATQTSIAGIMEECGLERRAKKAATMPGWGS
jgi:hypothetical protein